MDWKSKRVRSVLEAALLEDKAASDITTALTIDPNTRATGTIVAMEPCIVAGLGAISVFLEVFTRLGGASASRFEVVSHPEIFDGVRVRKGQPLAVIRGNAAAILSTERAILNLLGRMCGIATLTNAFVKAIAGTGAEVLDTRKTIPGLRVLDRYAVCCGGGLNHRNDLQDGILIKGNHLALGGGITSTLERALAARKPGQTVQLEIRAVDELAEALRTAPDSILLDNMTPAAVRRAVKLIRNTHPDMPIEAAGGITLVNVHDFASAGVNFVTIGSLTHSVHAPEINLRVSADTSTS